MRKENLASKVKRLRLAAGYKTKRGLALKASVSPSMITDIETGKKRNLSLKSLISIARALNVSLDELLSIQKAA